MKKLGFLFFAGWLLALNSQSQAFAQDENNSPKKKELRQPIAVEWFLPQIGETKVEDRTRVTISGRTEPLSKIYLNAERFPTFDEDKKVEFYDSKAVFVSKKKKKFKHNPYVKANKLGFFEMSLDLPRKLVQLPLKIKPPKKAHMKSQILQMNLVVKGENVDISNKDNITMSALKQNRYGLWAGFGLNYLSYDQQVGSPQNSSLAFSSFTFGSTYFKAYYVIDPSWDASFEYKVSPGVVSEGSINISAGSKYDWTIMALEATYSPLDWQQMKLWDHLCEMSFRFGVQQHEVPFLVKTGKGIYEMDTNTLGMATGGFQIRATQSPKWEYEFFLRYQHPVYAGSKFSAKPVFAFDGSMGTIYRWSQNWRIGGFWYGQYQQYDFSGYNNKNGDSGMSGTQTLLFSNMEVRLGYEW